MSISSKIYGKTESNFIYEYKLSTDSDVGTLNELQKIKEKEVN